MNLKVHLPLITGIVVSCIAFFFAFKNIPLNELVRYLKTVNYLVLIPGIVVSFLSFILRTIRWQWILKSRHAIPFVSVYHPLIIGFMLNCIFPGRVGEIARPILLLKRETIPFSTGLASVVCERMFDLICLIFFLIIALSFIHIDPDLTVSVGSYHLSGKTLTSLGYSMVKLCVVLIIGLTMISITPIRNFLTKLISLLPGALIFLGKNHQNTLKTKICLPLVNIIENFSHGLVLLRNPQHLCICLGLSLCIWLMQAASYHVITLACPGVDLTYLQTMAMMVMICFFIALPSVPGYWGIWEAGGIFALSLFSVAGEQAAGYTLINHAMQIFPVVFAGLISALMIGINFKQLFNQTPNGSFDTLSKKGK